MPRILSTSHLQNRRRRSSIGSSSSSLSMSYSDSGRIHQSVLSDWFSVLVGNRSVNDSSTKASSSPKESKATASSASPFSSLSSSGTNTPSVLGDQTPIPIRSKPRRQIIPRRSSTGSTTDDSWGQFVDTAEAERELIRHSRVLSKRELPRHSICY
ncbi:expressed unknown protein [Seminavis robusta]|uniref:Uncharacterized protein n=1 Tax=Seminavis robusta TaxID=568900 RepID=A0A9N8HLM8_9STRA|nr:expressed unknown protein [Seminavis robusta]|eukprot:Sro929_g221350.1 n/a (156) ;mRNA; f:31411-31878